MCNHGAMPRDGRPKVVDPVWASDLKSSDPRYWTSQRIADRIFEETGNRVTPRAVELSIANYRARVGFRGEVKWPWAVLAKDCQGPWYETLLAVYWWEQKAELSRAEAGLAGDFRKLMDRIDGVVTYHRRTGFHTVARRSTDDGSYFQKRSFDDDGKPVLV